MNLSQADRMEMELRERDLAARQRDQDLNAADRVLVAIRSEARRGHFTPTFICTVLAGLEADLRAVSSSSGDYRACANGLHDARGEFSEGTR